MAETAVVRVYRPSERRTQACHYTPAAIVGGLTMCGKTTRGMAGRAPEEHALAMSMRVCVDCLDHLGHPAILTPH